MMNMLYRKYKPKPQTLLIALAVVINLFLWLYTSVQYHGSTDIVPLHYTIYFGIDLIGFNGKLFIYPLLGTSILALNTFLGILLKAEKLLGYLLLSTSLLSQILIAVTEIALVIKYY